MGSRRSRSCRGQRTRATKNPTRPGSALGFTTIQWDVDTVDWSRPGTATIERRAIGGAHPGAIILQHDGGGDRSETLAALPDEITTLEREGYHFVTVTQLLGQKLIYK